MLAHVRRMLSMVLPLGHLKAEKYLDCYRMFLRVIAIRMIDGIEQISQWAALGEALEKAR